MIAEWKVGTFTGNGLTGNQTISISESWTPVCVIIYGVALATASANQQTARFIIGAAVSSTARFGMDIVSEDAATTMDTRRSFQTDQIISASSATTDVIAVEANFVSFGVGEFTINWANASSSVYGYCAFGGQSAAVGIIDVQASIGNQSVTGLSFSPKAVVFFNTIDNVTEGVVAGNAGCIGVGVSSTQRWAHTWHDDDAVDPSVCDTYLHTTACIARIDGAGLTVDCDYVGPTADGFTIDVQDAPAAIMRVGYVALGGDITAQATTFAGGASLGNESETLAITPEFLLFAGDVSVLDSLRTDMHVNFGAVSAAAEEFGISAVGADAAGTSATGRSQTNVYGLARATSTGGAPTIEGNVTSLDTNGFTVDWDTTPGARNWGVLALRNSSTVPKFMHEYRRRRVA